MEDGLGLGLSEDEVEDWPGLTGSRWGVRIKMLGRRWVQWRWGQRRERGDGKRVPSGNGMGWQRPVNDHRIWIENELRVVAVVGGGAGMGRGPGYGGQGLGC